MVRRGSSKTTALVLSPAGALLPPRPVPVSPHPCN
ncbi:hypothetical protein N008_20805 [Hymenobacter sp. APR13]|nr:hypothetical protein N008_20805 [Hymenobacter sp. APR13]